MIDSTQKKEIFVVLHEINNKWRVDKIHNDLSEIEHILQGSNVVIEPHKIDASAKVLHLFLWKGLADGEKVSIFTELQKRDDGQIFTLEWDNTKKTNVWVECERFIDSSKSLKWMTVSPLETKITGLYLCFNKMTKYITVQFYTPITGSYVLSALGESSEMLWCYLGKDCTDVMNNARSSMYSVFNNRE